MLERLLGTRCFSVSVWLRLSSLISSKGQRVLEIQKKITLSVDLMKNKFTLQLLKWTTFEIGCHAAKLVTLIAKIPHCCYWPELSVCSQVPEPRAGCYASGHSWRIHFSFGVSSGHSRCFQWAVSSERLNTSRAQRAQQLLVGKWLIGL